MALELRAQLNILLERLDFNNDGIFTFQVQEEEVMMPPCSGDLRIYDLIVDKTKTAHEIDLKHDIHPDIIIAEKITSILGEITLIELYQSYSETYNNLFAQIEITYNRDSIGLILERNATLKWYNMDGTLNNELFKNVGRKYNPFLDRDLQVQEGIERRRRVINELKIDVLHLIETTENITYEEAYNMGKSFLANISVSIIGFIESSDSNILINLIEISNVIWINNVYNGEDNTIKDYIINILNNWS